MLSVCELLDALWVGAYGRKMPKLVRRIEDLHNKWHGLQEHVEQASPEDKKAYVDAFIETLVSATESWAEGVSYHATR